jgi:hypothetical protein
MGVGGAGLEIGFPDDGQVALCLSDYRSEVYVWQPLVGFLAPAQGTTPAGATRKRTALLGFTGFFQFFDVLFPGAEIELAPKPNYPGVRSGWPPAGDVWAGLGGAKP